MGRCVGGREAARPRLSPLGHLTWQDTGGAKSQLLIQEALLAEHSCWPEVPQTGTDYWICAMAFQQFPCRLPGEIFYYSFPGLEMWKIRPHGPRAWGTAASRTTEGTPLTPRCPGPSALDTAGRQSLALLARVAGTDF